jgi:hypothetical protein
MAQASDLPFGLHWADIPVSSQYASRSISPMFVANPPNWFIEPLFCRPEMDERPHTSVHWGAPPYRRACRQEVARPR